MDEDNKIKEAIKQISASMDMEDMGLTSEEMTHLQKVAQEMNPDESLLQYIITKYELQKQQKRVK